MEIMKIITVIWRWWGILQRRIGERAVKDRWDDGVKIPGIVSYPIDEISYSKM